MKTRNFLIGIFISVLMIMVFNGCNSGTTYDLDPPLINGYWEDNFNYLYWPVVEGADYYRIYGLEFYYDDRDIPSLPLKVLKDPKQYKLIDTTTECFYKHMTYMDYVYAVRAFSNDGKSSDFSGGTIVE